MKNKKSISKWIKAILMVCLASLIYAVYFTELGKPESSESDQHIVIYEQTAVPTIFVKWQQVPTVALAWAYANQDLLKFAIIIHGLETNWDPVDWVCNPYITMEPPVPRRLSVGQMRTVYDTFGEAIQATYEYEIDARGYDSLTIDMDITIGPCADYLNVQESNVTPSDIPELVGNYHLSFQVPVNITTPYPSLTPASMALDLWSDFPIFPGGIESNDTTADQPVYHYIIENADVDDVQSFYRSQMKSDGWQLLGVDDSNGAAKGNAYTIWFAKDQDTVTIDIFVKENGTHVMIRLE